MADEALKYLEEEKKRLELKLLEARKLSAEPGMEEMASEEAKRFENEIANIDKAMQAGTGGDEETEEAEQFNKVIMEARPGVGGDEAKIWADELLRMYSRYVGILGWKVEILDEGVMKITGKGAFDIFRWETGVHRVQRVPVTEAAGRVHTSTASIVVLPEVPENKVEVREDDLIWEFTRGGGHGGQNVNKVATAVRLTHKPSGVIVQSRQERSQEQNRKIALALLRAQLWEIDQEKKQALVAGQRAAIGRSMRAEKIRTYNYPQNRVTDHRIGKSWYKLDKIVEGDLSDVMGALSAEFGNDNSQSNHATSNTEGDSDGFPEPEIG